MKSILMLALIALLAHSPTAFANKLAWHLPNTFSYHFTSPPQDAVSQISIKVPVEVNISVRRTEGSGYPQTDMQLTGSIQGIKINAGGKSYSMPTACLRNLRWPIEAIAIQQDKTFTTVLARVPSITQPTQTFFLRATINHDSAATQSQIPIACERDAL